MHRENGATLVMVPYLCNSPPKEPSKRDIWYTMIYPINTHYIYIYIGLIIEGPHPQGFFPPFIFYEMRIFLEALKNLRSRHLVELAWLTESQQEVTSGSALPCDFNRQDELVISCLLFTGSRVSKIHGDFWGSLKVVTYWLKGNFATWIHVWGNLRLVKDYDSCRSRLCMLGRLGLGANFLRETGVLG